MRNLAAEFSRRAALIPSKTAVYWGEHAYSYEFLSKSAATTSGWLVQVHHVKPGDRVGILLKNQPEFITVLWAVLAAGAVAVPINHFLKPPEIAYLVRDADIRVLVVDESLWSGAQETGRMVEGLCPVSVKQIPQVPPGAAPLDPEIIPGGDDDLAALIYTSGTTGHPKGAMLTHRNFLANVESCRQVLEVVELDRFVLLLPMFHSFMLTVCIFVPLLVGGSIVLVQSLHPPKAMVDEIVRNQGSILPAMAALFRLLAHLPEEIQLPLRLCISGAGPLPVGILGAFQRRFPTVPLIEGYGLTEASPVVSVNPPVGPSVAGTIGLPITGVEITIQTEAGQRLPDGEIGELCVRGENVMRGYWNDAAKTATTLVDGWLRTGDLGFRRPDGHFVITDRAKDVLKPNGINVYPREIEDVILGFPSVKECAVVGEPDDRRGEHPVAFVTVDASTPFDEAGLLGWLKTLLADFKLPKRVLVVPALPRNATGKVLKTELRDWLKNAHG